MSDRDAGARARPELWEPSRLADEALGRCAVWSGSSVAQRVGAWLPWPRVEATALPEPGLDTLVVVGGGSLIDRAKRWRAERSSDTRLVAVPSLWGSGAERSPIAVEDTDGRKRIHRGESLLPDVVVYAPHLLAGLPRPRIAAACGDAWAHAVESFLSPLACEKLQAEIADLIRLLLTLPIANDPRWLDASGRAAALQARASVGLVHGIAHVLEGPLRAEEPRGGWGHARLCATFLAPVLAFNERKGERLDERCAAHELDPAAIRLRARDLADGEALARCLPVLEQEWRSILRDPCTRTNCALVRPGDLPVLLEVATEALQ